MGDDNLMGQDEIEQLLAGGGSGAAAGGGKPSSEAPKTKSVDQSDVEALLAGGAVKSAGAASNANASAAVADSEDADKLLGQQDIENLLNQAGAGGRASQSQSAPADPSVPMTPSAPQPRASAGGDHVQQDDIEMLLQQAEQTLASIDNPQTELPEGVRQFSFEQAHGSPASTEHATFDLVRDVELDVKIELGRAHMYLEDILKLRRGWVVPLDKLAGDPVDIYVNGRLVARGEVLVMNDNFCVRVAELIAGSSTFK